MKDTIILFIHGFYGHVEDFSYIKKHLEDNGYATHSFILSGHDKVRLEKVTRYDWIKDCEKEIEKLRKDYKNIIIIGHSMGGVLTSMMAIKYKEVKKVILISPALEYFGSVDGKLKIIPTIKRAIGVRTDKEFKEYTKLSLNVSVPVLREFMKLVKEHNKDIYDIKCPILMILGDRDFIVPIEKIKKIYESLSNTNKKMIMVENGTHWFIFTDLVETIFDDIKEFIRS